MMSLECGRLLGRRTPDNRRKLYHSWSWRRGSGRGV